ncbi:MAG: methyltransferase domain-containing protein [bacterium]
MKNKLLKLLCCPKCNAGLGIGKFKSVNSEIKSGIFQCPVCQAEYQIIDFIPRFVETDKYVKSFSFEWTIHKTTQLDSATGRSESKDTFVEKTGIELEKLRDKIVLDAGCGMGRFMEVVQPYAKEAVGIDLSFAVNSAYENLKKFDNLHIIQADVLNLPLKKNSFDYIYSIGVLHHTPDTKKAFMNLAGLLKSGGEIAIWVYSNEKSYTCIKNKFTDFYRLFTVHIPKKLLWYLSHLAIPFYYFKKIPKVGTLIDLTFPMSNHCDWKWRVLDTFDWYSPKYQHKHTYREVIHWFKEAGLKDIELLDFPVAVKGRKQ